MIHVCLGSVALNGSMFGGMEFKTELEGWLYSTLLYYFSMYVFVSDIFFGGWGSVSRGC